VVLEAHLDIVLGVSMAPTTLRLALIEDQNADGVTVEQDDFAVAATKDSATFGAADQVIAAIVGTREGAAEGGYQLTSTGVNLDGPPRRLPRRWQVRSPRADDRGKWCRLSAHWAM
jgi:hypothetical protein